MNKQNTAFLLAGFAFGIIVGFGLFNAVTTLPDLQATETGVIRGPAGPAAMTQVAPGGSVGPAGAAGGAPMMAEINDLKRRITDDPKDIQALGRLANIYHDVAMWDQAIEYYELALKIKPDDPDLLTDLGVCFRGSQQYDRALALFEQAHKADSAHWQSLFNTVVVAAFDLGQFDRARRALESMERMNPQPPRLADLREAMERAENRAAASGQS